MYAPSPHRAPVRCAYGSDLMQSDLSNEAATLAARQQICIELAQAEADQSAAADNLVANHNATKASNQRLAEAERYDDCRWMAAIGACVYRNSAIGYWNYLLPCKLVPELLLSNWAQAEQAHDLACHGVTHVFSCIEGTYLSRESAEAHYGSVGIKYDGVDAKDEEGYSMLQHWPRFREFMRPVRSSGGCCTVHCAAGMNRSGLLAIAYVMDSLQWPLIRAVAHCAGARGPILWNKSFQRELVMFAREHNLLGGEEYIPTTDEGSEDDDFLTEVQQLMDEYEFPE